MLKTTAKTATALSWTELELFASKISSGWKDDTVTRETGTTNSHATFRKFDSTTTSNEARVTLFRDNHAWCPYCQKIWLFLEEKQIPYQIKKVTMFCYGDKEAWYKQIVPSGMLPALQLDNTIVTESDDILAVLENEFGTLNGTGMAEPHVIKVRRMERQLFRAWCSWLCYPARSAREESSNQLQFEKMAQVVDRQLGSDGPYFLGNDITIGDVIFAPYLERMAASLYYYKGFDIKKNHPNIGMWFKAMETRSTYRGTQSNYHTHAHDLPPQMGGCHSNQTPEALQCAAMVDSGIADVPETSHAEPETSIQEALIRTLKHYETILQINPFIGRNGENTIHIDEALRCALTRMVNGSECVPPKGTDAALRYLRDRVNVPRDMSIFAAKRFRSALEETAALDGNGQGPAIPIKHRRDQSVLPFLQARQEGKESSSKMCSGM